MHVGNYAFGMELESGAAWDGVYTYEALLDSGTYEYSFVAQDACCEVRDPHTGTYPGPRVVQKPAIAWVNDGLGEDEDWTNAEAGLSANWAPVSGADTLEYSVGTLPGSADVLGWTEAPEGQTHTTLEDITLTHGTTYYFSLRLVKDGVHSAVVSSDGITADHVPPQSAVIPRDVRVYINEPVPVEWGGEDDLSGIACYDVQYALNICCTADWKSWLTGTDSTSGYFDNVKYCRSYLFRCKATDRAGNVEVLPNPGSYTYDWSIKALCPKVALHVQSHNSKMNCERWLPGIEDCTDIETTYPGYAFDVFVVFHDLTDITSVEFGLSWPPEWSYSCAYTPCGDEVEGTIAWPGDGVIQTWSQCQDGEAKIAGWAWMYADGPGRICPTAHPVTGRIGVVDCNAHFVEIFFPNPDFTVCAGVYGEIGDDPCGPLSDPPSISWEGVRRVLR